jgi:hypothetical protein
MTAAATTRRCQECATPGAERVQLHFWPFTDDAPVRSVLHDECVGLVLTRHAAWWYSEELQHQTRAGACACCQTEDFSEGKWLLGDTQPDGLVTPELCLAHAREAEAAGLLLVSARSGRTNLQ